MSRASFYLSLNLVFQVISYFEKFCRCFWIFFSRLVVGKLYVSNYMTVFSYIYVSYNYMSVWQQLKSFFFLWKFLPAHDYFCNNKRNSFTSNSGTTNGIRTISQRKIAPRLGVGFGLGLGIGVSGSFSRGQLFQNLTNIRLKCVWFFISWEMW